MVEKWAKINCLCEWMDAPTGIDCKSPALSWSADFVYGQQMGYRIQVSESGQMDRLVWDSGFVQTGKNSCVIPENILKSGRTYHYTVEIETERGIKIRSAVNMFTTGILEEVCWDQNWIGGAGVRNHSYLIRWPFRLTEKPAAAAAFVASPNYTIVSFNGRKCRDVYLGAPTEFTKTVLYETFPLDAEAGENVLGIEIGNGLFAIEAAERGIAKNEHICAVRIRVEYKDGREEWLGSTSEQCYCTDSAPSVRNSVYTGEYIDRSLIKDGFDMPGYVMIKKDGWRKVFQQDPPGEKVISQMMEPIRITEERVPVQIWKLQDGSFTVDFGQNFAGWVRLTCYGEKNDTITVRYAELENADHTINDSSYNGIHISDSFILRGGEPEILEPRFSYRGFRYVNIEGLSKEPEADCLRGCVVHNDVARISEFRTDDELLNRFYECMLWSERSNLHGVPTDCPQRAERVAWLNDMTVRNECALYNYRLPSLYKKWTGDIRDCQGKISGAITDTAPFFRMGQKPADPVSTSFLLVPWNVYCFYGDRSILEKNYEACKRWVAFLKRHSDHYIVRYSPMGDWASPKKWCEAGSIGAGAVSRITPPVFIATGYLYYNYILLARMAGVLGADKEQELFAKEAGQVKDVFLRAYYRREEGLFCTGSQACNAFPLYLNMLDNEEEKKEVLSRLLEDIARNEYHLTTGNQCSKYVVEVLFQNGYIDEAYRLLVQKTYPSWGYMIENDATTLWERWEKVDTYHGKSNMASFNHAMSGAVASCFHRYLIGIRPDEQTPGFRSAVIRPLMPKQLRYASGSIVTQAGKYSCCWKRSKDGGLTVEMEIPFNCTADIYLPMVGGLTWKCQDRECEGETVSLPEGKFIHGKVQSGIKKYMGSVSR
ncbi:MAG: family 78 glycoside hydrolase catalytic domain [Lachnospiraceae bacterium]|nr:family 78 glycoside hydrolase catalytic domain [Lachnospiraceae bacterium]